MQHRRLLVRGGFVCVLAMGAIVLVGARVRAQSNHGGTTFNITPANTVLLDPQQDGNGIGVRISDRLTPGRRYRIGVDVAGNTGGPTESVFFWMGGYIDDGGTNHPSKYFVVRNHRHRVIFYPRNHVGSGPPLLAFFADANDLGDDFAQGAIAIEEAHAGEEAH